MTDPIREALAETIARAEFERLNRFRDQRRFWDLVDEAERDDWRHLGRRQADAVLAEFLVVPRSDIQSTEYSYRHRLPASGQWCSHLERSRAEALSAAGSVPTGETEWGTTEAEALERPVLPWTPIPEGLTNV